MAAPAFVEQLNAQVASEFAASQQYVAIAVHYDAETLPRLAAFFYAQALEERNHALMRSATCSTRASTRSFPAWTRRSTPSRTSSPRSRSRSPRSAA